MFIKPHDAATELLAFGGTAWSITNACPFVSNDYATGCTTTEVTAAVDVTFTLGAALPDTDEATYILLQLPTDTIINTSDITAGSNITTLYSFSSQSYYLTKVAAS